MSEIPQQQCATSMAPKLLFAQDAYVDGQQDVYVVVALSQRKQSQIMSTVGKSHCENQPFPTWNLVGQALSEALFNGQGHLKLKSTMDMHRRDYLLFERIFEGRRISKSSTAPVTQSILEVDFGRQLDCMWLGYWKRARPVVEKLVRECWCHSSIILFSLT